MNQTKEKTLKRDRRRAKIRSKVEGAAACPRLSVFRSNKGMFIQLIDDQAGKTIVSANATELKKEKEGGKVGVGFGLGKLIAEKAKKAGITAVVFDRGGYQYHGRVKAVADGAREGGLVF